jgi:hypothetical protein
MIIALATFAGILAMIVLPYWAFVVRPEQGARLSLRKRVKSETAKAVARPELLNLEPPLSTIPLVNWVLLRCRFITVPVQHHIVQSGLKLTVGPVVLASALLSLVMFAGVYSVTRSVLLAAALCPMPGMLPYAIVRGAGFENSRNSSRRPWS